MADMMDTEKSRAAAWFKTLRGDIVAAFEALEDSQTSGPFADQPPGRFDVSETTRGSEDGSDAGGGLMSVMRGGRVFEKVGVNISTVYGTLGEAAQKSMAARGVAGIEEDPRFWASGISLVAHMQHPHTPAGHMTTRMFWTPSAWWFGGGADLNPYIPHRNRARGVGGIFYDDLNTGDWEADFAFTQDEGRAFLPAFLPVTEAHRNTPWNEADKDTQLTHRGLYAEYNLVYDRGTKFGLATGHNPDAVLMSLPPMAKWV
ncbi:MAG: coproporphyrinogen III oxidase [Maritimibacter sp.]